jgi:hypothetical protein
MTESIKLLWGAQILQREMRMKFSVIRKIISCSLMLIMPVLLNGLGKNEARIEKCLSNKYNISAMVLEKRPISDYVITNNGKIIYGIREDEKTILYEFDINSREKTEIDLPPINAFLNRLYFTSMTYNFETNTIHTCISWDSPNPSLSSNEGLRAYYILYLETRKWEKVAEMDVFMNEKYAFYYYSSTNKVFILRSFPFNKTVYIFDMERRIFLNPISFEIKNYSIDYFVSVYNNPIRIFLVIKQFGTDKRFYCIYDLDEDKTIIFPNEITDEYNFSEFIHIADYRFICSRSKGVYETDLVEFNILDWYYTPIINSLYEIRKLKRYGCSNKYAFLLSTRRDVLWVLGQSYFHVFCSFNL